MESMDVVQTAQHVQTLIYFRGIERLLIVSGAIACVVLGTLLFRWGIRGTTSFGAEGAGNKIQLSNAAPGTILALFGMIVMVVSIASPFKIDVKAPPASPVTEATSNAFAIATSVVAVASATSNVSPPSIPETTMPRSKRAGVDASILYGNEAPLVKQLLTTLQGYEIKEMSDEDALLNLRDLQNRAGRIDRTHANNDVIQFLAKLSNAKSSTGDDAKKQLVTFQSTVNRLLLLDSRQ